MTPVFVAGETAPTVADMPPGPPPRPRLRRPERRPDSERWREVLPPVLAEHVAGSDALEAHLALVARVEAATVKARELDAAHAQAVERDRQAERAFAEQGRKLQPPAGPDAEAAPAQARRELELLERELPASADRYWAEAHPHLDAADREYQRLLDARDDGAEAHVEAALRDLDERAQIEREQRWVGLAMWESSIVPFDGRTRAVSSSSAAAELRQWIARRRDERQEAARRRHERLVELEVLFNPDRSPKRSDGRPLGERRAEAERIVREREAAA